MPGPLTAFAKQILPASLVSRLAALRARRAARRIAARNRERSAEEVFSEIYATNQWGGAKGDLYSGSGTHSGAALQYVEMVNAFITQAGVRSVVDIGCGDFHIGRLIRCPDYTGVDVVPAVVARNQAAFGGAGRRFVQCDVAGEGGVPPGDLCLVRQVFQHLSNDQILRALGKLRDFRYLIVTEHHPSDANFTGFNRDKVHGGDTRVVFGSGVYLDQPPFGATVRKLLECRAEDGAGPGAAEPIRSYLVTLADPGAGRTAPR
ncbi:class I SAM-dependent methyltransferase [Aquabacter spiritensis]|uniref:Methyltransferase family protein n=1 Tax=Aquabacter spiritensis TaxID=933073 RepID=A0A4V2UY63_9HYPH|nr:class I SAM-dependent methyltransferase [Aquabacter spiritensis]TCT06198.1 hypothetical protein EDC64_103302 [Aquabacter spiritensis]